VAREADPEINVAGTEFLLAQMAITKFKHINHLLGRFWEKKKRIGVKRRLQPPMNPLIIILGFWFWFSCHVFPSGTIYALLHGIRQPNGTTFITLKLNKYLNFHA